jgi:benzoyl-CoA reductase/2-hydroxyglutaryl-CoA dehydratase subunit BcrC/BadD/HgdB
MEKWLVFEIVALGKMEDYRAWFDARDKRFQELGMTRIKLYEVVARRQNMVCAVLPDMTSEEFDRWLSQYQADEVIAELRRERLAKKALLDGTTEFYQLREL